MSEGPTEVSVLIPIQLVAVVTRALRQRPFKFPACSFVSCCVCFGFQMQKLLNCTYRSLALLNSVCSSD